MSITPNVKPVARALLAAVLLSAGVAAVAPSTPVAGAPAPAPPAPAAPPAPRPELDPNTRVAELRGLVGQRDQAVRAAEARRNDVSGRLTEATALEQEANARTDRFGQRAAQAARQYAKSREVL